MTFYTKVVILSIFFKLYLPKLLPYGPASLNSERGSYTMADLSVQTLGGDTGNLKKIFERIPENGKLLLDGPETIILDEESNMYALLPKLGRIVSLTNLAPSPNDENIIYADVTELASFYGSPLGGNFVPGTKILYFADAILGLCRIDLAKQDPKVELVASKVQLSDGSESPILYADDVDIGRKSGMVYFSDACNIPPERDPDLSYDIMHAYKIDFMRGIKSGRLLRYDPTINKVDVLADGIWFANGIAVDPANEEFVIISETSMMRTLKYHLKGDKVGTLEVMYDRLVGLADGADCNERGDKCYIAIPTTIPGIVQALHHRYMPKILEAALKTLVMMLPKSLAPKPVPYGGVVEITVESGSTTLRLFQDPYGNDMQLITGVAEKDGKVYLGSLHNSFIGVLDLNAS